MGLFSSTIAAIATRLEAHTASGKLLAGYKFFAYPSTQVDGQRDLPNVRLWLADYSETFRPRGVAACKLQMKVSCSTVRTEGVAANAILVEKMLDALETNPSNLTKDFKLNDTLRLPFSYTIGDSFANDVSLNAQVILTLTPKKFPLRASRRS